jgi:hypothetical protein
VSLSGTTLLGPVSIGLRLSADMLTLFAAMLPFVISFAGMGLLASHYTKKFDFRSVERGRCCSR